MKLSKGDLIAIVAVVALLSALAAYGAMSWLVPAPATVEAAAMQAAVAEAINVHVDGELRVVYPPTDTPAPTMTPLPATPTVYVPPTPTPIVWPTDTPVATPTLAPNNRYPVLWDDRLDQFKARIRADESLPFQIVEVFLVEDGHWKDDAGRWLVPEFARKYYTESFTEKGGATHMFGLALKRDGSPLYGKTFRFWWPHDGAGGQDGRKSTTAEDGWVNFYANGRYDWSQTSGPYCLEAIGGEVIEGGGQPYAWAHLSIFTVWRER